jgi:hypothetical protein
MVYAAGLMQGTLYRLRDMLARGESMQSEFLTVVNDTIGMVERLIFEEKTDGDPDHGEPTRD